MYVCMCVRMYVRMYVCPALHSRKYVHICMCASSISHRVRRTRSWLPGEPKVALSSGSDSNMDSARYLLTLLAQLSFPCVLKRRLS